MKKFEDDFFERMAPIFPVLRVEEAIEHYEKLGFECDVYREEGVEEAIYGYAKIGALEIHLARVNNLDPSATTSAVYLYVGDADDLFEAWSNSGVSGRFVNPADTPYGLREFAHIDPNGNLLRVGSCL